MKNYRQLLRFFAIAGALTITFTGCNKDEDEPLNPTPVEPLYSGGAFICNEGAFMQGNATLDFFSYTTKAVISNVFQTTNQRPLGDVLQSMAILGDTGCMVLNNSNKVELVNMIDMKEIGVIENVSGPRYIIRAGKDKAYVSQWGDDGKIKVIDTKSLNVIKTLEAGAGPEQMIRYNGMIYVANGGGWGADSTITVINPSNDVVVGTIEVGYNPKSFAIDASGSLWVLCYGHVIYDPNWNIVGEKPSMLVKLNGTSLGVEKEVIISTTQHPAMLAASPDKNTFYYGGGFGFQGIWAWNNQSSTLDAAMVSDLFYYGFGVDPKDGKILGLEAPSFTEGGKLHLMDHNGSLQGTYTTGIGPNSVVFY